MEDPSTKFPRVRTQSQSNRSLVPLARNKSHSGTPTTLPTSVTSSEINIHNAKGGGGSDCEGRCVGSGVDGGSDGSGGEGQCDRRGSFGSIGSNSSKPSDRRRSVGGIIGTSLSDRRGSITGGKGGDGGGDGGGGGGGGESQTKKKSFPKKPIPSRSFSENHISKKKDINQKDGEQQQQEGEENGSTMTTTTTITNPSVITSPMTSPTSGGNGGSSNVLVTTKSKRSSLSTSKKDHHVSSPPTNSTTSNQPPPYMGDILDDIFGGSISTPGVKASGDILLSRTVTPALAFEEFEQIRTNPISFLLFYEDVKEHKVLESLHFILEVEEYTALPEEYRLTREKEIMDMYIVKGSPNEINVPDANKKTITEKSGKAEADIFLEAQKHITHMLIRNVDNTWKYKKSNPKIIRGKEIKKAIDKTIDPNEQRTRDLIYYFVARRITPLMYQARTAVVSLERKVKVAHPIATLEVLIKKLSSFTSKSSSVGTTSIYVNGKSFYQNAAGIIFEKKTKQRTTSKKGVTEFEWNEKLAFEVKDFEMQAIEFNLWEKKITANTGLGWFIINIKDVIPNYAEEFSNELIFDLQETTGKVTIDLHYKPDKEELARQAKEREEKEKAMKVIDTDFEFLYS